MPDSKSFEEEYGPWALWVLLESRIEGNLLQSAQLGAEVLLPVVQVVHGHDHAGDLPGPLLLDLLHRLYVAVADDHLR